MMDCLRAGGQIGLITLNRIDSVAKHNLLRESVKSKGAFQHCRIMEP